MPACDRHLALVETVNQGDPTDDQLEAYAEEVPSCPDCRQVLAVAARVHPQVLSQGGTRPAEEALEDPAMARLAEVLETRASPRRRVVAGLVLAATAAAAALALWSIQRPAPVPGPAPVPVAAASPPVPRPAHEAAVAVPATPAPIAPTAVDDDAVADATPEDLPPWEDARGGTAKGAGGTLSLALVLANPRPAVGEVVPLTIAASQPTPATLCVRGPEEGVVWRGDLPEGRTALTKGGQPIGFAFEHTGDYRFELATADDPDCADPVQRVTVRVDT